MFHRPAVVVVISALSILFCTPSSAQTGCPTPNVWPKDLTPPPPEHGGQNQEFQTRLLKYMQTLCYRTIDGWKSDVAIRGTGPYVQWNYGTHAAAVRIWYSPKVVQWLEGGRKGDIPEGEVIIKEQYATPPNSQWLNAVPPACFQYMDEQTVSSKFLSDWSIMIREPDASKDGWYWVEVYNGMPFVENQYPNGGYGQYCVRCHSSAEKQSTFSSLDNIHGDNYLTFYIDQSWRVNPYCQPQSPLGLPGPAPPLPLANATAANVQQHGPGPLPDETPRSLTPQHLRELLSDHEKHELLEQLRTARKENVPPLPNCPEGVKQCMVPEVFDRTVSSAQHPGGFVSSDQCQGCHSTNWPWMLLQANENSPQVGVSPYSEWRWSPMGLAGRDPVFYSQVESELAYIATIKDPQKRKENADFVKNTCLHCHGVMGQRTFAQDHPNETFDPGVVNHIDNKYGSLARDGISCSVCHRIKDDYSSLEDFLKKQTTGDFNLIAEDEIHGPFGDEHIVVDPMKDSLGYTPKFSAYTTSSRLCGSCHVIDLPVVDHPIPEHSLEQNTYVEWLNSQFENELTKNNPNARTCQDCHMRDSYSNPANGLNDISPLPTKIATVEDEQYPGTTHRLPLSKITVTYRSTGFRRHDLLGLNGFLLEMFNLYMAEDPADQNYYNNILGVRQKDYMSNLTNDLPNAIQNVVLQAQQNTATVSVNVLKRAGQQLVAEVTVQNLTGHRFPSGVGFRRAFLQFQVMDSNNNVVWISGGTNSNGEIVGPDGKVLPTEYFRVGTDGKQQYQPHFSQDDPITQQTQVQIYEELLQDADGKITTSFIRRDTDLKDNRILPIGWRADAPIPEFYLHATYPVGGAWADPVYHNGKGQSIVTYNVQLPAGVDVTKVHVSASVYYQTIPPYFLRDRFEGAPKGEGTQRLKYLVQNMNLSNTDFANWKLLIAQDGAGSSGGSTVAGNRGKSVGETARR